MSGRANGTAAVAADPRDGTAGGDGRSFAAARAARRVRRIPRIGSFAGEAVVGFVGHQEFGCVGIAEQDGAGFFQARDDSRVGVRDVVLAEERAGGTGPAGDVERGFYRKRDSFKGTRSLAAHETRFAFAGACAGGFRIDVHEGIQLRLNLLDAPKVSLDELDWGKVFAAEFFESFHDGKIKWFGHRNEESNLAARQESVKARVPERQKASIKS